MNDKTTRLDEIAARLNASPDGSDRCPVSECAVCTQVRDARALLAVVREVAGLHQPCHTECLNPRHEAFCEAQICKTCDHIWPCPTGRALQALTETTETTERNP